MITYIKSFSWRVPPTAQISFVPASPVNLLDTRWFSDSQASSGLYEIIFSGTGVISAKVATGAAVPLPLGKNTQNEILTPSDETYCVRLEFIVIPHSGNDAISVGFGNTSVIQGVKFQKVSGNIQVVPIRDGSELSASNIAFPGNAITDIWIVLRKGIAYMGTSPIFRIINAQRNLSFQVTSKTDIVNSNVLNTIADLKLLVIPQGNPCVRFDYFRIIAGDDIEEK